MHSPTSLIRWTSWVSGHSFSTYAVFVVPIVTIPHLQTYGYGGKQLGGLRLCSSCLCTFLLVQLFISVLIGPHYFGTLMLPRSMTIVISCPYVGVLQWNFLGYSCHLLLWGYFLNLVIFWCSWVVFPLICACLKLLFNLKEGWSF